MALLHRPMKHTIVVDITDKIFLCTINDTNTCNYTCGVYLIRCGKGIAVPGLDYIGENHLQYVKKMQKEM